MSRSQRWSVESILAATTGKGQANALDALHLRAYLEFAVGDFDNAARLLNEAIGKSPGEPAYHFDLALAYWHGGNFARAEEAFLKAAALDPRFAEASYNAGLVAARAGKTDRKGGYFASALRRNPLLLWRALVDVVTAAILRKPASPIDTYAWRLPAKDFPATLDIISERLIARGRPEAALRFLERALELERTKARHQNLAVVLEAMNKQAEARRHRSLAQTLTP